jgi:PAS domain S-box-containing protein
LSPAGRLSLEVLIALALLESVMGIVRPRLGPSVDFGVQFALLTLLVVPLFAWRLTHMLRARDASQQEALTEGEQGAALALSSALARAGDVSEAAAAVNDALQRSTGLARTAVLLYQDGVCRFVGWRGLSDDYRRAVEGHCPWKEGAPEAEPLVIGDAMAEPSLAPYRELLAREGVASLAFVPIFAKNGVAGKLMLYGAEPRAITRSAVRAAHVVAVSLGAAVTRLRMTEALARSESRLRAVIDTAMDAVVSMDDKGRVSGWNAQAETILGWSAAEALGRPLDELVIPPAHRAAHRQGLANYLATGVGRVLGQRLELQAQKKDGTSITVELSITPVHAAGSLVFSGFLRDISAQKRAANELVEARAAAEAASRAKSEFLANMSHEIRTPLTAILGYAELLRDDGDLARAPDRRLATIDTIQGAGQHLLTVINDILDLSKIEAGRMTVEIVEMSLLAVLQDVEGLMRPRASEKSVALTTRLVSPVPEHIHGDPTRLRQILVNLVGNAVKFTGEGRITLLVRCEARGDAERLVIDVEDTGPGLTPAQSARLFAPFGQADASVTRRHGGTGLGLTISHRLAELLGGNVALERTQPGQGSCFRLELPLRPVPGSQRVTRLDGTSRVVTRTTAALPALSGRVLLAEDGRDNQYIIAFYLRRAGAEVDIASNGRLALEMLDAAEAAGRPYELLLTDIQMPEMDGYTLTRILRARGSRLAIVALTAHAMAEDRQRCIDAGCDDYAVKPLDKARLLATCAQWIAQRRS